MQRFLESFEEPILPTVDQASAPPSNPATRSSVKSVLMSLNRFIQVKKKDVQKKIGKTVIKLHKLLQHVYQFIYFNFLDRAEQDPNFIEERWDAKRILQIIDLLCCQNPSVGNFSALLVSSLQKFRALQDQIAQDLPTQSSKEGIPSHSLQQAATQVATAINTNVATTYWKHMRKYIALRGGATDGGLSKAESWKYMRGLLDVTNKVSLLEI